MDTFNGKEKFIKVLWQKQFFTFFSTVIRHEWSTNQETLDLNIFALLVLALVVIRDQEERLTFGPLAVKTSGFCIWLTLSLHRMAISSNILRSLKKIFSEKWSQTSELDSDIYRQRLINHMFGAIKVLETNFYIPLYKWSVTDKNEVSCECIGKPTQHSSVLISTNINF